MEKFVVKSLRAIALLCLGLAIVSLVAIFFRGLSMLIGAGICFCMYVMFCSTADEFEVEFKKSEE